MNSLEIRIDIFIQLGTRINISSFNNVMIFKKYDNNIYHSFMKILLLSLNLCTYLPMYNLCTRLIFF